MDEQVVSDLDKYIQKISNLRIWKQGDSQAPHKFILLLSVINIIDENIDHENKFTFEEIENRFNNISKHYFPTIPTEQILLESPFYHLTSEGFWHHKLQEGAESIYKYYQESRNPKYRFTKKRILETIDYAFLNEDLYQLAKNELARVKLREVITMKMNPEIINLKDPVTSLFQHEDHAIRTIEDAVKRFQIGRLISNFNVFDQQTNDYYECDILLIASSGIYVIELKHWTGHIRISPYNWIKDDSIYRRDPHQSNRFKAKIIKGIYQHQFRTYPNVWSESVVVMTNQDAIIEGASPTKTDKHCPTFDSIDNLIDYLRYRKSVNEPLLSSYQIESIENYFRSLRQTPKRAYSLPGYEIVEQLTRQTDPLEFIARPMDGRDRNLKRFRIFTGSLNIELREKERYAQRARNTLDAVAKIGDHTNILKVWRVPDESGMLIEGSDWSEEGSLHDLFQRNAQPLDQKTAFQIIQGILSALAASHREGVIHRAVKPENILMVNGIPKLMNYDLSYHLEGDRHVTVIPHPESIPRDAYTAPEIFSGKDIDESSDLFSVGVILYEMLTGKRPFEVSTDLNAMGGQIGHDQIQNLRDHSIPNHITDLIKSLLRSDRRDRFHTAGEVIDILTKNIPQQLSIVEVEPNKILDSGSTYDVYTIEEVLAKGAESQVYRAKTVGAVPVVLKIFNRDVPVGRIQNEESSASAVSSPYLARAKRLGYWNSDRYFIEMNYIEGRLMRQDIEERIQPDVNQFSVVALSLLQGLASLHHHKPDGEKKPILHGDIKPDNIILTHDEKAVLIDFGISGPPRTDLYQGTDGYVAPDLMRGADLQFCENGDLFALGVTLFEWLAGKRPYEDSPTLGNDPRDPKQINPNIPEPVRRWLLKSVQTSTANRFQDVDEMRKSFEICIREEEPESEIEEAEVEFRDQREPIVEFIPSKKEKGNPFVAYLNSLHNITANNENALAEKQAINPYFPKIHVPLKVTDYIERTLKAADDADIILTGHAGDGKTTIGLELYKRLKGLPDDEPLPQTLRAIENILSDGNNISIVKDMSEIEEGQRQAFFEDNTKDNKRRYLIISNTGALINSVERFYDDRAAWLKVQNELLTALEGLGPQSITIGERKFQIINLSLIDNITTACQIFERMLNPKLWDACNSNDCQDQCPIYKNVKILQAHWATVRRRVEWLYRRLYEYGQRLTLRDMTAHIAYSITAGLDYESIIGLSTKVLRPPLRNYLFFNMFFGDSSIPAPQMEQLKAIRYIQDIETGTRTHPELERQLWMKEDTLSFKIADKELSEILMHLRQAGQGRDEVLKSDTARKQMRRLLYCYATFPSIETENRFISIYLNSPMIVDFTAWQSSGGRLSTIEKSKLKRSILHVLQEHFTGIRLPENAGDFDAIYITLNRHSFEVRQSAQIVLEKFLADDFDLILSPHDSRISAARYQLELTASQYGQSLTLELPFLDYVTNRHQGEIAQQLQAFYSDRLERFKVGLLRRNEHPKENNMMLVRLQLNHRFKSHSFSIHNKTLEVTH